MKAIGELLFEPVGLNYPETVRSELNRRDKRQTLSGRTVAAAVCRRIDVYLKGVQSARTIAELHPSTRERLAVRRREFRTMRDSHAQAHEQSILAQLATPVHILYGNAVASYTPNDTAGQPARRQQMQFSSMSVSMEMPRLRSLDPTERLFGMQQFGED